MLQKGRNFWYAPLLRRNEKTDNAICAFRRIVLVQNSYTYWNYILSSDSLDFVCCYAGNKSSMVFIYADFRHKLDKCNRKYSVRTVDRLLAARSPAKRAAKVSPLTAVSGNAGQTASFRKAANTTAFKIETALGIHHAKAKKKNYILMTGRLPSVLRCSLRSAPLLIL